MKFYLCKSAEISVQFSQMAPLFPNFSIIEGTYIGSHSIVICSTGSVTCPSASSQKRITGGVIVISNPSLLIVSIKIPKCKSPLPLSTIVAESDLRSHPSILRATSFSASQLSLSLIAFLDILVPSFPAKGEVFTFTEMDMMGGSIGID